MNQVQIVPIPTSARRTVGLTRICRGMGYLSALAAGLYLVKTPAEKIVTGMAILGALEVGTAALEALNDQNVADAMTTEGFGTPQEKLEAAGTGVGIGFLLIGAAVVASKILAKKEPADE